MDMLLNVSSGEIESSSTISAVNAITSDPDMLTEESSNKALDLLDMSSGNDLTPESAENGMTSLSNLVCAFKINEIDSDKNFKES